MNRQVTHKPGVLLVTTSPLLPLNAGGRIYTWGTTEPLASDFRYHLIALATDEELEEFERDRAELTRRYRSVFDTFHLFPRPEIPGHMSRLDALRHLWFHTRHGLPLMDISYYSNAVVDKARELVDEGTVDLIEVDHAQMAFVRRFVSHVPAILVNHNIEGALHPFWMTERWTLPELVVWRAFASVSRHNTRRIEIENAYGFSSKLFISPDDADRVADECPKLVLPVPMEVGKPRRVDDTEPVTILWLGSFGWPPNLEGMVWFLEVVWPALLEKLRGRMRLEIAGSNPPGAIRSHHDGASVVVHGYVEDLEALKSRSQIMIAPLLTGSGVRVKVVEGLAAGIPVVATSKGAEGLSAVPGRDLLIADSVGEFVETLERAVESPDLRQRLSRAGQDYVRSTHDPRAVADIKRRAILDALSSGSDPVG